jgi:hypothetical protein
VIARLERGGTAPSLERVRALVDAAGLELRLGVADRDDGDWAAVTRNLALTTEQRWDNAVAGGPVRDRGPGRAQVAPDVTFDPAEIVRVLDAHGVRYVLIGGFAASLHGAAYVTTDLDITPDPAAANLRRLSAALTDLRARTRAPDEPDGLPFAHDPRSLATAGMWNLVTRVGDLDISSVPSGTQGYADLRRDAVTITIHGTDITVASLADVVRSKEAAGRDKDRAALPVLRRLLDRQG